MMKGRDYLRDPRGPFDPGDTIIITSQSEEATFALKPLDLRSCIIALQRFLLCAQPHQAEIHWWLRSSRIDPNMGRWVELREAGVKPFYTFSDGVEGRSSPVRPAGVARDDIVVITVPTPPPTALKKYFHSLVEALPHSDSWKPRLLRWEHRLNAMYSPQFLLEVVSQHYTMIRSAFSDGGDAVGRLRAHCVYIHGQYVDFNLDGFSVAYASLITRLLTAIYPLQPAGMLDQSFEQFARAKNIEVSSSRRSSFTTFKTATPGNDKAGGFGITERGRNPSGDDSPSVKRGRILWKCFRLHPVFSERVPNFQLSWK